jgi:hypothetical protein
MMNMTVIRTEQGQFSIAWHCAGITMWAKMVGDNRNLTLFCETKGWQAGKEKALIAEDPFDVPIC